MFLLRTRGLILFSHRNYYTYSLSLRLICSPLFNKNHSADVDSQRCYFYYYYVGFITAPTQMRWLHLNGLDFFFIRIIIVCSLHGINICESLRNTHQGRHNNPLLAKNDMECMLGMQALVQM